MTLQERFISRLLWNWGAPAVQTVTAIAMLPVITAVLGPAEIGAFAVVMSAAALIAAVSGMGSTYLLSAHYPTAEPAERRALVSTMICVSVAIAALAGLAGVASWPLLVASWPAIADIPVTSVALAMAATVAAAPWIIALDTLTLRGQARPFAAVGALQAVLGAGVTTVGLHVLDLGLTALFVSTLAVSLLAGMAGLLLLRRDLAPRISGRWLIECLRVGPIMSGAHILETLHNAIERMMLTSTVGLAALGLYAHSQQYRNMAQIGVKGLARSVWPVSLDEARSPQASYALTNRAWQTMTVGVTFIGVFCAFIAEDIVRLLTHGKFTAAAPYITLWMIYILVQNTGKPQIAALYANQRGVALGWIGQGAGAFGILLLLLLIPWAGLAGAFAALFLQQLSRRVAVHYYAGRVAPTPFQDGWAVAGGGLILGAFLVNRLVGESFASRSAVAAVCLAAVALIGLPVLRDALSFFRARPTANP